MSQVKKKRVDNKHDKARPSVIYRLKSIDPVQFNLPFYGTPFFRILCVPGMHDVSKHCMKKLMYRVTGCDPRQQKGRNKITKKQH